MKTKVLSGLVILMLVVTGWVAAQDKPWFDKSCEMCKNFMDHPGLMENMDWETLKLSNGILMLSTVTPDHLEAYHKANAACNVLGEKLQTGHQAHLCGSCDAMGMLMMKGAMMEDFKTNHGGAMLLTSNDSTIVAELHQYSDRNAEEMEKMAPPDAPVLE